MAGVPSVPRWVGSRRWGGDGRCRRTPCRAGTAGRRLQREVLADGDPATGDMAAVIDPGGSQEQLVELRHRPDMRDRDQKTVSRFSARTPYDWAGQPPALGERRAQVRGGPPCPCQAARSAVRLGRSAGRQRRAADQPAQRRWDGAAGRTCRGVPVGFQNSGQRCWIAMIGHGRRVGRDRRRVAEDSAGQRV
jgi:hypothetical protein